jgi:23S rRNA pseudouridine1911/1915/1917 synthase
MPVIEVPFEVEQNYDGWRLDRYLQQKITRLSRVRIQRIIRERLRFEGRSLKPASQVRPGMRFFILKDVEDEQEPPSSVPVRIIYDDAALLVLDKPAGLAVHPSARYYKHTITQWLSEHAVDANGQRPDLGHRLDRETSGVLICGRGIAATRALKYSFSRRETHKTYLAIAEGRIGPDAMTIDVPMRLTEDVKVIMEVHPDGMPSVTGIKVLARGSFRKGGAGVSLVECRPETGRQHQIRVHLKSIGHPIVGDKIYGGEVEQFLRFCRGEQTEADRELLRLPRHALHAWKLVLPHPVTRETLELEAPLAPDLQQFCDEAIVWDSVRQAA